MVDTLVDIVATTLTNTTLAGGTQTLLTAPADTSYVLREWHTPGNPLIDNLTLSVNDFDAGINALSPAGGSLIIPPNGTLKAHSTSYPLVYENLDAYYFELTSNDLLAYKKRYIGVTPVTTDSTLVGQLATLPTGMNSLGSSLRHGIQNIGDAWYQILQDSNSSHSTAYWATAGGSKVTLHAGSYHPSRMTPTGVCWIDASTKDLHTHTPAGGDVTVRASVPNTSFTTYSRDSYMKGWLFWVETNGDLTEVHAISLTTGAAYNFTSMTTATSLGANWQLIVSYDEASDKFYIYRLQTGNNWAFQAIPDVTVTTMNAAANDSDNSITSYTETSLSAYGNKMFEFSTGSWAKGHPQGSSVDGNTIYYIQENNPYNEIYSYHWVTQANPLEYITNHLDLTDSYGYYFRVTTPSAAEITADNYTQNPNVDIRAVGIKSVE